MEKTPFEQRRQQRHEQQQQPQQSVLFAGNAHSTGTRSTKASPRSLLHALAISQARKQSGRL